MAYVYLLDIYNYIEKRLSAASDGLEKSADDVIAAKFQKGRIDALTDFQHFLKKNFNPKLPRRIKDVYFGKKD